jgi:hypothetical protein
MEDLHDKLMREFRIYFTSYQQYAVEQTKASAIRTRKNLYNIRKLALELREELLQAYKQRPKRYSPYYKPRGQPQKPKAPDQESAT